MHLISSQYHVGKASKSSRYVVAVSGGCYDIVAGMLFTLGTPVHAGERPKYVERSLKIPKNVLLHGHHQRRPASQVGGPYQVDFESVSESRNSLH